MSLKTTFTSALDDSLRAFCAEHGLMLDTRYREEEVRSITVVDDQAASYQLWVEPDGENWVVCAWDKKARHINVATVLTDFPQALESAWQEISRWIEADGNTRSAF